MIRLARATDSIWRVADLEYGDPYEDDDEAGWFRDRHDMYKNHGSYDRNNELMTLVPGWDEAKRKGWKSLGGGNGPFAYRGSGDRFEAIAPKHMTPDEPHWDKIPQRWIRYSLGEGGIADPYAMHAKTFRDAIDDRNLAGWNLYENHYDPETEQFHQRLNDRYPTDRLGPGAHADIFAGYKGHQSHFDWIREQAGKKDMKLRGEF